ncbi:NRDE family protein [Stenotrophomonas sp.]|uniref:NRDE family protein n=1 Tax=unclassified Stenotrophomonas TaxID=196198 RepID=UPI0019933C49|nr:NRDE family protein [Stenotrophomonas sp.]MBD3827077.1 NRDE family protein [Stenotrophomonas sp.]
MCLLALAWKAHPRWQLVMAGNRDEFHARPTAALAAWPAPDTGVMAGRDLRSGGTWAGIGQNGRMAVVTNVRDPLARQTGPSRGALVADFLRGSAPAAAFADALAPDASAFAPFNLLLADRDSCQFLGNHPLLRRTLSPGLHGMSNGPLDAPWPKTVNLVEALGDWIARGEVALDPLWQALANEGRADDDALPDTGIGLERERWLSSAFIRSPDYGTRASTVIALDERGHGFIQERRFAADGRCIGETRLNTPAP